MDGPLSSAAFFRMVLHPGPSKLRPPLTLGGIHKLRLHEKVGS